MRLSRRNRNQAARAAAGTPLSIRYEQPRKPTKALVAGLISLAGVFGVTMTHGTAELVLVLAQLVLVTFGVWRTRNDPRSP